MPASPRSRRRLLRSRPWGGRVSRSARLLSLLLGALLLAYLLAVNFYFPQLEFRQSIGAGYVSQGIDLGPFYLEAEVPYTVVIIWRHPKTGEIWETTYRLLDSNLDEVQRIEEFAGPQSLAGRQGELRRHITFLTSQPGYYYLRVMQKGGDFSYLGGAPPVMRVEVWSRLTPVRVQLLVVLVVAVMIGTIVYLGRG